MAAMYCDRCRAIIPYHDWAWHLTTHQDSCQHTSLEGVRCPVTRPLTRFEGLALCDHHLHQLERTA